MPSEPIANQAMKQSACYGKSEGPHLSFARPPLRAQGASAIHEVGIQACWHLWPCATNCRNGVSATKRANLFANPHCLAMASRGPANSWLNLRQGASGAQSLRTSPFEVRYSPQLESGRSVFPFELVRSREQA